jgi:hypothetical protein
MTYEYRRPWPETLAGALIGAMLMLVLAFHPATASLIADGRTAIVTMAIGALAGALVSWRLATPLMGKVTRLEQEIIEEQRRAA